MKYTQTELDLELVMGDFSFQSKVVGTIIINHPDMEKSIVHNNCGLLVFKAKRYTVSSLIRRANEFKYRDFLVSCKKNDLEFLVWSNYQ